MNKHWVIDGFGFQWGVIKICIKPKKNNNNNLELLRQIYTTAGRGAKNIKFEITKKICEHFTLGQNAAPERINSIFRLFLTKSSYPKSLKRG